jgi:hypothetical protein
MNYMHYVFRDMESRWGMARDFALGGKNVINPGRQVNKFSKLRPGGSYGPSGANYDWEGTSFYLWKDLNESDRSYYERCRRQVHIPIFGPMVNIFKAGIFRVEPSRTIDQALIAFRQNVDQIGTNINTFTMESLGWGLVFGRYHSIVLRGTDNEPVLHRVSPLNLVDWHINQTGMFEWIKIRVPYEKSRMPGEPIEQAYRYYIITETTVETWESNGDLIETYEHGMDEVPIATLWTVNERTMDCESPISSALDGDRMILNRMSVLDNLERYAGFPIFLWPEAEGTSRSTEQPHGPEFAQTYDPEAGKPEVISPDSSHAIGIWERTLQIIEAIRDSAGVLRGAAEGSKELRSAAALSAESENKRNRMSEWSSATEEYEIQIWRLVEKLKPSRERPVISYARDFNLRAIQSQINDLTQLAASRVVPRLSLAIYASGILSAAAKEAGVPDSEIERMRAYFRDYVIGLERQFKTSPPEITEAANGSQGV